MKATKMKMIVASMILAGALSVSGQTKSPAKKAAPIPQGLPAAAEKIGDGAWRWKDPQGKTWIYHRTAFGYSRIEDTPEQSAGSAAAQAGLRVVEVKADQVTFEQPTPFGKSRWTKAVAELSVDEKAAYEAHEKAAKSPQSSK